MLTPQHPCPEKGLKHSCICVQERALGTKEKVSLQGTRGWSTAVSIKDDLRGGIREACPEMQGRKENYMITFGVSCFIRKI